jgi:PKD repeat protein
MRSLPLKAATFLILAGAWACGGDGSGVGPEDPTANFTAPTNCTAGTACNFTDASTGTVATWSWNFGDNSTLDTNQNPSHIFAAANTYNVTLTVTGNGKTSQKTVPVTVGSGTTTNVPPTAAFTAPLGCTVLSNCQFTDGSTDTDGAISAWDWNFGDGTLDATDPNPVHQFGAEGPFTVTLIVTDDLGGKDTTTQTVTVGAAAAQDCTTSGALVTCSLTMTQKSTVVITLNSTSCQIGGNRIAVAAPRRQNAFFNVCSGVAGTPYTVKDANGAALIFNPNDVLQIEFTRGQVTPPDPTPGPPSGAVTGTSPTWTVTIEDGGNPQGAGEPDFNDVVLGVQATVVP